MANDEDICCSCGNINSFPKAFFDNFHVADVGIIVCTSGRFSFRCEDVERRLPSRMACISPLPVTVPTVPWLSFYIVWIPYAIYWAVLWWGCGL